MRTMCFFFILACPVFASDKYDQIFSHDNIMRSLAQDLRNRGRLKQRYGNSLGGQVDEELANQLYPRTPNNDPEEKMEEKLSPIQEIESAVTRSLNARKDTERVEISMANVNPNPVIEEVRIKNNIEMMTDNAMRAMRAAHKAAELARQIGTSSAWRQAAGAAQDASSCMEKLSNVLYIQNPK